MAVTEANGVGSPAVVDQPPIEAISKSIWQLTEDVLELLRSQARSAVHKQMRPDLHWLDELTETQGSTVIAVRQLCEEFPGGVALKKLAETMGVTPAAASVMVDLLVKKKMLKRTRSKSDRRAVLIRLTPDTAGLFEISEHNLQQTFTSLEDTLGPGALLDWQRILLTAKAALRLVVGEKMSAESDSPEPESAGDDKQPSEKTRA
jgi:DNA-binding MarR family transcriptional regulator